MSELLTFLSNEANWAQNSGAYDICGKRCNVKSPRATKWCLLSSLMKLDLDERVNHIKLKRSAVELSIAFTFFEKRTYDINDVCLSIVNDKISHQQLLTLIRRSNIKSTKSYCGYGLGIVNSSRY